LSEARGVFNKGYKMKTFNEWRKSQKNKPKKKISTKTRIFDGNRKTDWYDQAKVDESKKSH
jgi:hypothetical protein